VTTTIKTFGHGACFTRTSISRPVKFLFQIHLEIALKIPEKKHHVPQYCGINTGIIQEENIPELIH
jgi:hypothetical protein